MNRADSRMHPIHERPDTNSKNCHSMWFVTNTGIILACTWLTFIMSENRGNLLVLFWKTATGFDGLSGFQQIFSVWYYNPSLSVLRCLSLTSSDTPITLVNITLIDIRVVLELMSWHVLVWGENISLEIALQPLLQLSSEIILAEPISFKSSIP